jgi:hypothetical protein
MRFSIVFDDGDAILAASIDGDEPDNSIVGSGVGSDYRDFSDDVLAADLQETVERPPIDLVAKKSAQVPARKEAGDGQP